jgi:signal transduction histidine kinase
MNDLSALKAMHDIRSPLGALKILLSRLSSKAEEKALLTNIIDRIEAITLELKNLNAATGGYRPLAVIVQNVIEEFRLVAGDRCQVHVQIEESLVNQMSDSSPLSRALSNLINNAVEADAGLIKIRIQSDAGKIVMKVFDDGEGIPAKTLRLIEAGQRCSPKKLGCGLGLSQVYDFAHRNKGAVTLQSQPDCGTEVTVVWHATEL